MAIIIHQESWEGEGNDNGVEENPIDNISLLSETKGEDIKEPKEEIDAMPTQSETNKVREPLSLLSLHKATNPYRPPIPLKCCPTKADNKDKPLKLKAIGSFIVNISIGGKEKMQAMLDLRASLSIMPYSVYLRLGLGQLKLTPMTLQLAD